MAISVLGGVIPQKSSHCSPLLHGNFSQGVFPEKSSIAAHCSPLLHGNFSQWGNSWKVLPLQPIAAHSYMAISVRGVIPEKSSHCSPLQPNLTWQFQSGGGGGNSWKFLPLQPIAAHSYMAISVRGVNSSNVLPLHPNSLHHFTPSEQITPTLLHQFNPHRQITPHSYIKMGGF